MSSQKRGVTNWEIFGNWQTSFAGSNLDIFWNKNAPRVTSCIIWTCWEAVHPLTGHRITWSKFLLTVVLAIIGHNSYMCCSCPAVYPSSTLVRSASSTECADWVHTTSPCISSLPTTTHLHSVPPLQVMYTLFTLLTPTPPNSKRCRFVCQCTGSGHW